MGDKSPQPAKPIQTASTPQKEASDFLPSFVQIVGDVGAAIASFPQTASQQIHDWISPATRTAGEAVGYVGNNWFIRRVSRFLNLGWLVGATSNIDLEKAEAEVRKLQQEHPNESPSQIAHRIMIEKAKRAGGIGLATSVIPGAALALLAVDLAATTQLQAEMVHQIAAAYGLDLKDPARKGEVLGIFGLGLGGGRLLKAAGLGLLRNIPFAGAVIGASADATMLYSLGYAACRFYESKLKSPADATSKETLQTLKQQSDQYLETAIAQQTVMDRILVNMIRASYPQKQAAEIFPQLKALNLSAYSLKAISADLKSPQPLDTLLNQLNRDFAIPLAAQCYRIAQADGVITPEESKIIEAIANKFNIDMNSIKADVDQAIADNQK